MENIEILEMELNGFKEILDNQLKQWEEECEKADKDLKQYLSYCEGRVAGLTSIIELYENMFNENKSN